MSDFRRPFEAVDYGEIMRAYPPPPEYFETAWVAPPDEIARVQLERLQARALTASKVPFFARRWEEAGFDPRSITTLDDLWRAPSYTVDDIRRSIEAVLRTLQKEIDRAERDPALADIAQVATLLELCYTAARAPGLVAPNPP